MSPTISLKKNNLTAVIGIDRPVRLTFVLFVFSANLRASDSIFCQSSSSYSFSGVGVSAMETNLQHEDLLIKLRAKLNEEKIKLWESPYVLPDNGISQDLAVRLPSFTMRVAFNCPYYCLVRCSSSSLGYSYLEQRVHVCRTAC